MNHLKKLSAKNIVISVVIGLFFAASMTDIAYPISSAGSPNGERTPYIEGVVHYDGLVYRDGVISSEGRSVTPGSGTAYEDVFSHPDDLFNNVQNSQSRFFGAFAVTSLISLVVLSVFRHLRKSS